MQSIGGDRHRVYIGSFRDPAECVALLRESINWLKGGGRDLEGSRVFLKPNLTWRKPEPGVTTTPAFIEAVVVALKDWTDKILIGESDGGYHSFKAEESFQSHGLYALAQRYGVRVVNLSHGPVESRSVEVAGYPVIVELPAVLLHDVDAFVTMPVPKVHVMTRVSLGFKNQWGCQPGVMRLRNHPDFARRILAINKVLRPCLTLFDGTYFLDKTGPMMGEAVRKDLLVASDDVGAGSLACCEIMGIDARRVRHLRLARREGMLPHSLDEVILNRDLKPFKTRRFRLRRSLINYIALAAFHSNLGTKLFYDSAAASPLHRVLYAIRRNRLIGRVLYGAAGPPEAEGRRS